MPKVGMEPVRKMAMIHATIAEIGEAGTLDVTVSKIAKRAGMSSALAHHYFGSKEKIFIAAMRHVLNIYGQTVRAQLALAATPVERIRAIIDSSFDSNQFERDIVAAWLTFYQHSMRSPDTRRLLNVYSRRLHANLTFNLKQIFDSETAEEVAQGLASLIDGFYVRAALQEAVPNRQRIKAMVNDYLELWLERENRRAH